MNRQEALEVLGITDGSSHEEAKAAYRKLAFQYHPDRNPGCEESEKQFKRIQEAYDVVQQPQEPWRPAWGPPWGRSRSRQNRRMSAEAECRIDFVESIRGCVKEVLATCWDHCEECKGHGSYKGESHCVCHKCNGLGEVSIVTGPISMRTTCMSCFGRGVLISKPCDRCNGIGQTQVMRKEEVQIPAGAFDGMHFVVLGKGNKLNDGERDNLGVRVLVRPHRWIVRREDDLHIAIPVPFAKAILGGTIDVPGVEGIFSVRIPTGIQSGTVLRLPGQGAPDPIHGKQACGDMYVKVILETPSGADDNEELRKLAEGIKVIQDASPTERQREFNDFIASWHEQ